VGLIVFRVDGSHEVGLGHLMRCFALADAFDSFGYTCRFFGSSPDNLNSTGHRRHTDPMPGGLRDWSDGAFLSAIAQASVLVTDSYAIDQTWQAKCPIPLLAISDDAGTAQKCDLRLLPTTIDDDLEPTALGGPEHALISHGYRSHRTVPHTGTRLLVSCGAGKDGGLPIRIANALAANAQRIGDTKVTLVIGSSETAAIRETQALCSELENFEAKGFVNDMAGLAADHDVAIGCPATSSLERCCLGLSQILIPIADNQLTLAAALDRHSAALVLSPDTSIDQLGEAIVSVLNDLNLRKRLAGTAFRLVDGQGCERVVKAVEERLLNK